MEQKSLYLYLIFLFFIPSLYSQSRITQLRETLTQRLRESGSKTLIDLPPIRLDTTLIANATYENGYIILGNVQRVFHTFEDSLSLIYHEYIHHLLLKEKKFKISQDKDGKIYQWDTGKTYIYTPYPEEVAMYLRHFQEEILPSYPNYVSMSLKKKEIIISHMQKDFSQSQEMPFIYAPSNLAKEEIYAYEKQLQGEQKGLYTLSEDARANFLLRIKQLKATYKRRRGYEKKKDLRRSGEKKG